MPSFYRPPMPRQLPLTPPEFVPSYNSQGCGGAQYPQNPYATLAGINHNNEEGRYDFAERYGQTSGMAAPSSMLYSHPPDYPHGATSLAPPHFYQPMGAPILPPLVSEADVQRQRAQEQQRAEQQAKEEKPVGGVSAKLDYEMEVMTDFVSEMAQGIIQPGRPAPQSFRKWVHQVLCATRLPSATILLSLHYLSVRMGQLSTGGQFKTADSQIFRFLTMALVLGSKFLDDNTFINKSWAEVSGIEVRELNALEANWLDAFDFKLHRDPYEPNGFSTWQEHWKNYEAQSQKPARLPNPMKLSPLDTTVQHRRSVGRLHSPVSAQQQVYQKPPPSYYQGINMQTPAYTHFDPWSSSRPAMERSPASAPHTGPTTPEYYGGANTWAPLEGYSRRTMFGFPSAPQTAHPQLPSPQQQTPLFPPSAYTPHYNSQMWGGSHGFGCNCGNCGRTHPAYFMSSGFGAQPVAG
ncbi:hypothetical protein K490DRAFT_74212 [Saccharata proteae CBS 121410]|uniref:Cyclin-like protein n=1 Tax=Saccharata proteae CBS 121410 TaxID=1314787 RepID=A0A9P4HRF6_9PEZI|nr:hypothetical protein K490DRAFT_74212 [Saccharata proteae CBS 121410]